MNNSSLWPSPPRGRGFSTQQKEEDYETGYHISSVRHFFRQPAGPGARVPGAGAKECSNASFKGSYGASCGGFVGDSPLAVIGVLTADGKGNISGVETLSVNGVITSGVTFTGTYTVNADCTGSIETTTPDGVVTDHDFILDDNKKEIRIIVNRNRGRCRLYRKKAVARERHGEHCTGAGERQQVEGGKTTRA